MLAGYAFVDALVAEGVDVLALGNSKHLLELNTLVLCGTDPARRELYARHIEATEHRFYEEPRRRHPGSRRVARRATATTRPGSAPPAPTRGS